MENLVSLLPLLACPIGMGLLMWFMRRSSGSQQEGSTQVATESVRPASDFGSADRLIGLRAELEEVRAQQAAIAVQIGRLSPGRTPGDSADPEQSKPAMPASSRHRRST